MVVKGSIRFLSGRNLGLSPYTWTGQPPVSNADFADHHQRCSRKMASSATQADDRHPVNVPGRFAPVDTILQTM